MINRKRVQRLMRLMGLESTAPQPTTSTPGAGPPRLSVSAAGAHDRTAEPGLGHGYHLHPDGARLRLPGGDHRLVLPPGPGVAAVQHAGHGLLHRGVEANFDQASNVAISEFPSHTSAGRPASSKHSPTGLTAVAEELAVRMTMGGGDFTMNARSERHRAFPTGKNPDRWETR